MAMDPNANINDFLDAAGEALKEAGELSACASELKKELAAAEEKVNHLTGVKRDQIEDACNKRLDEIDRKYDRDIEKYEQQLDKAKKQRNKAKNQGIQERIEDETADLRADIKAIEARTRAAFKADHVPDYCSSGFISAIYFPDSVTDILIIIFTFIIAFFMIPYGIYKLLFDGSTVALVIIYVLDILIFGGIYIGISRHTVMEHAAVLRQAKLNRRAIAEDKQEIAEITRSIENDKSESYYDLAKYDDDIAHIKQQLAGKTMEKNDAVNTFETVTRNIIIDEITAGMKPETDEAEKALDEVRIKFTNADVKRKAKAAELAEKYEPYLGREFMSRKKVERLKEIVGHGTATSLQEAIEEYNRQYDI